MSLPFRDRHDAGRQLGDKLHCYAGRDTVVLGLPRGGVPVAYAVAHALQAPLDVFMLRYLHLAGEPGTAFGLVASGGVRLLRKPEIERLHLTAHAVDEITQRERLSLVARERTYRAHQQLPDLQGRVVILVDDGTASEQALMDTIAALRVHEPRTIIVAVPLVAADVIDRLRRCADDVVCVVVRAPEVAAERWYLELLPLSHTEVRALLSLSAAEGQSRELAGLVRL
jgi:putative phosphoribosyl transferase